MVVCVPLATLYSEPDLMSEQVDEMLYGDEAEILETSGSFCKVKTEYDYVGWIVKSNLFEKLHEPTHRVSVPFADLLFEGKNYYRPAMVLPRGAKVDVGFSHSEDRYGFCVLPSKKIYYVHKNHVTPLVCEKKNEDELREAIVNTAFEYLGVQYRWGGRSHSGIDCSGLVFNAYRFNGIHIWRDANFEMNKNLRKISIDDAKKGDLLFFKGHVAMYLGDNRIIHATASPGKVIVQTLDREKGLIERFICAGTAF